MKATEEMKLRAKVRFRGCIKIIMASFYLKHGYNFWYTSTSSLTSPCQLSQTLWSSYLPLLGCQTEWARSCLRHFSLTYVEMFLGPPLTLKGLNESKVASSIDNKPPVAFSLKIVYWYNPIVLATLIYVCIYLGPWFMLSYIEEQGVSEERKGKEKEHKDAGRWKEKKKHVHSEKGEKDFSN